MAYLLDSDVFIQAKNLHYGFDFCPAFWEWIDQQAAAGTARSIEKVRDELIGGGDELAIWAQRRSSSRTRCRRNHSRRSRSPMPASVSA